jgi:hypothetical protein
MQSIKNLAIAAVAALALIATVSAATASAAPAFEAGSYPALATGTPLSQFALTVYKGEVSCDAPSIWGELTGRSSELIASVEDSNCYPFGSKTPLKMNGCKFIFDLDEKVTTDSYKGTYDIGPAGCGPITTQIVNCKESIPAQEDLAATYQNLEDGTVKITSEASGIEYTQSSCNPSGTFTDGKYLGSWLVDGNSAWSASGNQNAQYNHVFSAGGKAVQCVGAAFSVTGPLVATRSVAPQYSTCKAFGFLSAKIELNGCSYSLQATHLILPTISGTAGISCPAGKAIEIIASNCVVKVPAQVGLTGFSAEEGSESATGSVSVSSIEYLVTKDGALCPFSGLGTYKDGTYNGQVTMDDELVGPNSWQIGDY